MSRTVTSQFAIEQAPVPEPGFGFGLGLGIAALAGVVHLHQRGVTVLGHELARALDGHGLVALAMNDALDRLEKVIG